MATQKPLILSSGGVAQIASSDTVAPANLGTGTRDGTKFLRDDGAWTAVSAGSFDGGSTANDITVTDPTKGLIITASDYSQWRYTVTTLGQLETVQKRVGTPQNFSATASGTTINLDWDAVPNATGYVLDRATDSGFTTGVSSGVYSGTDTSYSNTGLSESTVYYYRLRATLASVTDSLYATDSETTSTGSGDVALVFTSASPSALTESPSGTWSGNNTTGVAGKSLAASTIGHIQMDVLSGSDAAFVAIGLDRANNSVFPQIGSFEFSMWYDNSTGTIWRQSTGGTSNTGVTLTPGTNTKIRVNQIGTGQVLFEYTHDGTNWSTASTSAGDFTSIKYPKANIYGTSGTRKIVNPKISSSIV